MQIKVWLRKDPKTGARTLRTDFKLESNDDPTLQKFGFMLIKSIENGGEIEAEGGKK